MRVLLCVGMVVVGAVAACSNNPNAPLVVNGACAAGPCALSAGNPSSNNPPGPTPGGGMKMRMGP